MSDFLANLVRRGAGLAPIVRSRPAASPGPAEDVSAGVESEAQPATAPVAALPVAPAAQQQPMAAAPLVDMRPAPVALSAASVPLAVVQRTPDGTARSATPAPAVPSIAPVIIAPAERTTIARTVDEAAPHSHVASTGQVAAPTTTVRVIEGSRDPGQRIVDIRREVISVPVPMTSAALPPGVQDETPSIRAAPSSPEVPSTQTRSVPPIDHGPDTTEVPRARPTTASETVVMVRHPLSRDPVRQAAPAPLAQPITVDARGEEPTPVVSAQPVAIPVPVAALVDGRLEEPAAPRAPSAPIVEPRTEKTLTVERVVELPAAAETVRPRPTIEVLQTPAPATLSAAPDASTPERIVQVRIGAVEIHAAPSADMQMAPAAPAPVAQPSAGFDEFVRLRTYEPWQW